MNQDKYMEESNMDLDTMLRKYYPNRTYNDNDKDRNVCVKLLVESMDKLPPETENSKYYMFYPLLDCTEESNNWSCSDCRVCMYCCLPIEPNLQLNRFNYGYGLSDSTMKSYKQFPPCFEEKVDHLQRNCLQTDKVNHVVCVSCNVSAHRRCCNPVVPNLLFIESWKCDSCTQCISCGYRDPSYVEYLNWGLFFFFCLKCWELLERSNYCGICYKVWTNFDTSSQKWVQCEGCKLWIHVECDELARLITECPSSRNQNYRCYVCRSPDKILRCMKLLEQIFVIDKLNQFRYPVSPNFVTYWRLVTKPMNLVMLFTKLEGGKYVSFTEFIFDTFLIPYNAKMVNMPNTKIYRFATIFERKLKQLVTSIMQINVPEIDAMVNAGVNGGDFLAKEKLLLGGTKELDNKKRYKDESEDNQQIEVEQIDEDYVDEMEVNNIDEENNERRNKNTEEYQEKEYKVEGPKLVQQKPIENYRSEVIKFNFTFEFIISKILNIDIKYCQYAPPQYFKNSDLGFGYRDQRLLGHMKTAKRSKPLNYRLVGEMFDSFVPCGLNYVVTSVVSVAGTPFVFPPTFNDKEDFVDLVRTKKMVMMNKNQPRNPYFESLIQKSKGMANVGVYEFYIDKQSEIDKMSRTLFKNGFLQFNDVCIVCGSNSFQSYLIYCEDCAEPMHYYCAGFMFPPKFMNYKRFKCAGCTRCEKCEEKVCCNHQYDLSNINNFHFGDALGFIPTLITNIVLYSAQIMAEESLVQQVPRSDGNIPINQGDHEKNERNRVPKFATFLDGRFKVDHNGIINSTSHKDFTYQTKFPLNTVRCIGCGNSTHLSCIKIINPPTNPYSPYCKFSKNMNSRKPEGLFGNKTVDWSLNGNKSKVPKNRRKETNETEYNEGNVSKEENHGVENGASLNEDKNKEKQKDKDRNFRKSMKDFKQDPHKYFKKLLLARSDLLKKEETDDKLNGTETSSNVVNMCINYLNGNKEPKEKEYIENNNKEMETNNVQQMEVVDIENKDKGKELEKYNEENNNNETQYIQLDTQNGKIDMKYVLLLAKKLSLCDDLIKMIQVHMASSPNNRLYMANGANSIYNYKLNHDSKIHNQQNGNKRKQQVMNEDSKEVPYLNGTEEKDKKKRVNKVDYNKMDNIEYPNGDNNDIEVEQIDENCDEIKEEKETNNVQQMEVVDIENKDKEDNKEVNENKEKYIKDNKLHQSTEYIDGNLNEETNYSLCKFGHIFNELEKNNTQGLLEEEENDSKIYDKSYYVPETYLNWEFDGSGLFTCTAECQQNYYKLKDFNYSHELLFSNSLAMQFDVLQEKYNLLPIESKEVAVEFHIRSIRNGLKAQEEYEKRDKETIDKNQKIEVELNKEPTQKEKETNKESDKINKEEVYISNHCALCGKTIKKPVEMKSTQKIISSNEKTELLLPNSVTNWIMCSHCSFYRKYKKMVSRKIRENIDKMNGTETRNLEEITIYDDTDSFLYDPNNYRNSVLCTMSSKHFTNLLSVVRKWMLTSENLLNYLITLVSTLVPRSMSNSGLKRVVYNFLKKVNGSLLYSYVYNAMISSPLSPVVFTNWKKTLLNYHLMDFDEFSEKIGDLDGHLDNYEMRPFDDFELDYIHHNPKHRTTLMNLSYFIMIKRYTELISHSSRLFWTYRDLLSYKIFFKNLGFTRKFDKTSPYYKYNKKSMALLSTRLQKLFYHIINGDIYCDKWSQKLKHRFPYLRKHMAHLILNGDVNWYKDAETNPNSPWLLHYSRVDGGTTSPSYVLGKISYEAEAILSILSEFVRCTSTTYKPDEFRKDEVSGVQGYTKISNTSDLSNGLTSVNGINGTQNQLTVEKVPFTQSFPNEFMNKLEGQEVTNRSKDKLDQNKIEDKEEVYEQQNGVSKPMTYKKALAELRKVNKVKFYNPRLHLQEKITIFDSKFNTKSIFNFDMDQLYKSLKLVREKINVQSKMEKLESFLYENIGSSLLVDVVSARAITGDIAIGDRLTTNEAVTEFTGNAENLIKPALSVHLKMCNNLRNKKVPLRKDNKNQENTYEYPNGNKLDMDNKDDSEKKTNVFKQMNENGSSLIDSCCLCGVTKNTLLRGSLLPWRNGYVHSECLLWSVSDVYLPRTYNFNYDSFYTLFERRKPTFVSKITNPMFVPTPAYNQKMHQNFGSRKPDDFKIVNELQGFKEFEEETEKQLEKYNERNNNNETQYMQLDTQNEPLKQDQDDKNQNHAYEEENGKDEEDLDEGTNEKEDNEELEYDMDEEHDIMKEYPERINKEIDKDYNIEYPNGDNNDIEVEQIDEDDVEEMEVDSNETNETEYNEGDVSKEENYMNRDETTTEGGDETFQGQTTKSHRKPTVYFTFPEPEPKEANINLMYLPVLPPVQIPDSAVDRVYKLSLSNTCSWCNTFGASVKCAGYNCNVSFHLSCALESSSKLVHLLYERDVKDQEYAFSVFPVKMFYTRRKIWCSTCFKRIEDNVKNYHMKRLTKIRKTDLKIFFSLEGISSNAVKIVSRQTLQSVRIMPRQVDYNKMDNFLNLNACSYGHIKSSYSQTMFNNPLEPKLSEIITNVFKPDFIPQTNQKINSEYDFVNKFYLYGTDKNLSSAFSNRIPGLCYPKEVTHNAFRVGSVTVLNIGDALLQDKRGAFFPVGFTTVRKYWNSNYFNTFEEQNNNMANNNTKINNKEQEKVVTNKELSQKQLDEEELKLDGEENNEKKNKNGMEGDKENKYRETVDKNEKIDKYKYFGNTYRSYYLCSIRCLDGMPYFTMDLISPPNSRLPNERLSEGNDIYEVFDNFKAKLGLKVTKMNVETFFGLNLNIVLQQMRYELGFTMLKRATQFCKISAFKKSVFGSRFNNYDLSMRLGEPKLNLPYRFNKVMTLSNITTALDFKEQGQTDLDLTDNRLNRSRQRKQFDMSNTSTQYRYLLSFPAERRLDVKPSVIHGLGLFANEFIPAGEPVVEYVGELIRDVIGDQREEVYSEIQGGDGSCYMFRLDEQLIVDATNKGNMSRFINHSCDPNCLCRIITCENGLKHIVVFAKTDLNPGDEVTYDYQFGVESETRKLACLCGAPNCLGRMN